MKEIMLAAAIAVGVMALSGCESVKTVFQSIPDQIEQAIGSFGEGEYEETNTLSKGGKVLFTHTIKWRCDRGENGKLAGCHQL